MVEYNLEQKLKTKLDGLLKDAGLDDFQIMASLDYGGIKAHIDDPTGALLIVKVSPRSYSSPTIPICQMDVVFSLIVRADVDFAGDGFLHLVDALMAQYERWQKCQDDAHDDFSVDGFQMTGFQLGNGETAIDAASTVYTYTHAGIVFGVID